MNYFHQELANGRWQEFSLIKQMANIGSEVFRAISWREKKDEQQSQAAFYRSLELIDLTIADKKNLGRLFEIARIREVWADYFAGQNQYGYTAKAWQNYFYAFAYASQIKAG